MILMGGQQCIKISMEKHTLLAIQQDVNPMIHSSRTPQQERSVKYNVNEEYVLLQLCVRVCLCVCN